MRCRMRGLDGEAMNLAAFRRRLGVARAGLDAADAAPGEGDARWEEAQGVAAALPDEVHGPVPAARPRGPERGALPRRRGPGPRHRSRSPGRAKRLLAYVETRGTIVCRMDYRGNRIVALPALNCETAPGDPKAPADGKASMARRRRRRTRLRDAGAFRGRVTCRRQANRPGAIASRRRAARRSRAADRARPYAAAPSRCVANPAGSPAPPPGPTGSAAIHGAPAGRCRGRPLPLPRARSGLGK